MNILLDYVFPVTAITPTPAASTGFLKQVCLVVAPDTDVPTGVITACTTNAQIAALTENTEGQQFLAAGMSKVYILPMDDLNLADALEGQNDFYTLVISSDFDEADMTTAAADGTVTITSYANLIDTAADTVTVEGVAFVAQAGAATLGTATFRAATSNEATATSLAAQINAHADLDGVVTAAAVGAVVTITAAESGWEGNDVDVSYTDGSPTTVGATLAGLVGGKLSGGAGIFPGTFSGVIGVSSDDSSFATAQAAIEKRCSFWTTSTNKAKNMCYAFGKLLSNALNWRNQQYITMPFADDTDTLGEAESLFDDKVSFVISDDEFGERLAMFAAGGKAIVAPYITRNLEIDMQSATLSYISGNQPQYTLSAATQLENKLKDVIQDYVDLQWITEGTVEVRLIEDNFVASGFINIAEPKALWRVFAEMQQTL